MLCAGFPCQPFSNASGKAIRKRKDEITPYLLKFITQKLPKYLLLENVPAFLKTETATNFFRELRKNYTINYENINPLKLGISNQNRPRLLIFGKLKEKEPKYE
jgi:site-specific DNA-cytosine methylase